MFKKILEVDGVQKLNKDKQKSVKGGSIRQCTYRCNGTTAHLTNGNYLYCTIAIYDATRCGGGGNGGVIIA